MSDSAEPEPSRADELAVELERLAAENRRLREAYANSRRTRYRRTALGLAVLGGLGLLGGYVFAETRAVLWALGATGLFAGLLTAYLTPERFVAATVAGSVYRALAANAEAAVDELGLAEPRLYLPVDDETARLFVPQHAAYDLPDRLDQVFVTEPDAARGLCLEPTGGPLFEAFTATLPGDLADAPGPLLDQLTDGLVADFELVGSTTPEVVADDRVTVGVTDCAFGPIDRFDHPVPSLLGVGLAVGLDRPVAIEIVAVVDDRYDAIVAASWDEPTAQSSSAASPPS